MELAYLVMGLISLLFWVAILQAIIAGATKTRQRMVIEMQQLNMLAAIAIKSGVADEEVTKILNQKSAKDAAFIKKAK